MLFRTKTRCPTLFPWSVPSRLPLHPRAQLQLKYATFACEGRHSLLRRRIFNPPTQFFILPDGRFLWYAPYWKEPSLQRTSPYLDAIQSLLPVPNSLNPPNRNPPCPVQTPTFPSPLLPKPTRLVYTAVYTNSVSSAVHYWQRCVQT